MRPRPRRRSSSARQHGRDRVRQLPPARARRAPARAGPLPPPVAARRPGSRSAARRPRTRRRSSVCKRSATCSSTCHATGARREPSPSSCRGERATVVVEVRSIASRSVRRRGMRPLVEATVADETGSMKATFFNQPWLVGRYPPGTRLVLHGKFEARNRFGVQAHAATTRGSDRWRRRRPLPGHGRALLDRDPGARAPPRGLDRRRARAAAGAAASPRAAARSRRRAQRRPLPT